MCCFCLFAQYLLLTISFSFLAWVTVIKDALCIMSPGQAAEFNPFQNVRQWAEVIGLHEMHRYPV